ncbi:MAG: MerR family transcriptional regulator [Paracoccaceae bacterium]
MQIREAARFLEISPRSLRHYEREGLLAPARDPNGYRRYGPDDLRRAERIRDLIAVGFSTREIAGMSPCLADDGAGACEAGIEALEHKLAQIDKLIAELGERRQQTQARIQTFRDALSNDTRSKGLPDETNTTSPLPDRLPGR